MFSRLKSEKCVLFKMATKSATDFQCCSICLENKLLTEFYKNISQPNGLQSKIHGTICKLCSISKRKPTHRYCKKCGELKEIDNYRGCSVTCKSCATTPLRKKNTGYSHIGYGKMAMPLQSSDNKECVSGFADWLC